SIFHVSKTLYFYLHVLTKRIGLINCKVKMGRNTGCLGLATQNLPATKPNLSDVTYARGSGIFSL
ncbi:MAG: hypothetical protein VW602_04555, partial [Paracoccaceae bacterium]